MGVDWLACNYCGETFPDCGDYVYCECGNYWCGHECASEDGYEDEDGEKESSCKYCRNEYFSDSTLLEFALKLLSVTRDELSEQYKNKL